MVEAVQRPFATENIDLGQMIRDGVKALEPAPKTAQDYLITSVTKNGVGVTTGNLTPGEDPIVAQITGGAKLPPMKDLPPNSPLGVIYGTLEKQLNQLPAGQSITVRLHIDTEGLGKLQERIDEYFTTTVTDSNGDDRKVRPLMPFLNYLYDVDEHFLPPAPKEGEDKYAKLRRLIQDCRNGWILDENGEGVNREKRIIELRCEYTPQPKNAAEGENGKEEETGDPATLASLQEALNTAFNAGIKNREGISLQTSAFSTMLGSSTYYGDQHWKETILYPFVGVMASMGAAQLFSGGSPGAAQAALKAAGLLVADGADNTTSNLQAAKDAIDNQGVPPAEAYTAAVKEAWGGALSASPLNMAAAVPYALLTQAVARAALGAGISFLTSGGLQLSSFNTHKNYTDANKKLAEEGKIPTLTELAETWKKQEETQLLPPAEQRLYKDLDKRLGQVLEIQNSSDQETNSPLDRDAVLEKLNNDYFTWMGELETIETAAIRRQNGSVAATLLYCLHANYILLAASETINMVVSGIGKLLRDSVAGKPLLRWMQRWYTSDQQINFMAHANEKGVDKLLLHITEGGAIVNQWVLTYMYTPIYNWIFAPIGRGLKAVGTAIDSIPPVHAARVAATGNAHEAFARLTGNPLTSSLMDDITHEYIKKGGKSDDLGKSEDTFFAALDLAAKWNRILLGTGQDARFERDFLQQAYLPGLKKAEGNQNIIIDYNTRIIRDLNRFVSSVDRLSEEDIVAIQIDTAALITQMYKFSEAVKQYHSVGTQLQSVRKPNLRQEKQEAANNAAMVLASMLEVVRKTYDDQDQSEDKTYSTQRYNALLYVVDRANETLFQKSSSEVAKDWLRINMLDHRDEVARQTGVSIDITPPQEARLTEVLNMLTTNRMEEMVKPPSEKVSDVQGASVETPRTQLG